MNDFSTELPERKPPINHYERYVEEIFFTEPPKRKPPIGYHVHTVKPGKPTVARLLGQAVGLYTHFVESDKGAQTRPCYPPIGCPYCGLTRRRWNAYVPALLRVHPDVRWFRRTLHISEMAFEALRGQKLRGMLIRLSRKDHRRNSELVIKIEEPAHYLPGLPPEWDVKPILRKLFGLESFAEQNHVLPLEDKGMA